MELSSPLSTLVLASSILPGISTCLVLSALIGVGIGNAYMMSYCEQCLILWLSTA